MSARVVALARRPGRREPMEGLDRLTLDVDEGVVEDFSGRGHRQVTLLEREAWEAVERELG
ncbi:MAG: MOSC domain-containing protein, partial [Planctomycetes bacterium]|nr:MOSC domain-containing protein [Planctomycetota bacterium]